MVVRVATLDGVFHALADPTRRDILTRCVREGLSVSGLARKYPMSFAAVQKHVTVLQHAGLVRKRRRGREQVVSTELEPLREAQRILGDYETAWRGRVDRMSDLLGDHSDPDQADPDQSRTEGEDR